MLDIMMAAYAKEARGGSPDWASLESDYGPPVPQRVGGPAARGLSPARLPPVRPLARPQG